MPRDGLGTQVYEDISTAVNNAPITENIFNFTFQDIEDELNNSMPKAGGKPYTGDVDFNGNKLVLDIDSDTSITADTDDQIDIEIGGSDELVLTANKGLALNSFADASAETGKVAYAVGSNDYSSTDLTDYASTLLAASSASSWITLLETGGNDMALIDSVTASNDATIELTTGIDDTFDEYVIAMLNVVPEDDTVRLRLRTSSDGGSTFDSASSSYNCDTISSSSGSGISSGGGNNDFFTLTSQNSGNSVNEIGVSLDLHLVRPSDATYTTMHFSGATVFSSGVGLLSVFRGCGIRKSAGVVDALQIYFNSGNIVSGEFKLYGIVK